MPNFITKITTIGQSKIQNAINNNVDLNITTIVLGDGNGNDVTPSETQTALVNQVASVDASYAQIEDNQFIIKGIIPREAGGFTIREKGLIDEDGDLIVVGNYPTTYKPTEAEGDTKEILMSFVMAVGNADNITVNPIDSSIYATKDEINGVSQVVTSNKLATGVALEEIAKGISRKRDGFMGLDPFEITPSAPYSFDAPEQMVVISGKIITIVAQPVVLTLSANLFQVDKVWITKDGYVVSNTQPTDSLLAYEITRLNKWAYHPSCNPLGTAKWSDGDWWSTAKPLTEASAKSSFQDNNGRVDGYRFDRVYDFMISDKRLDISIPFNVLHDSFYKARDGVSRGHENLREIVRMDWDLSTSASTNNADGGVFIFPKGGSSRYFFDDYMPELELVCNGKGRSNSKRDFVLDYLDTNGLKVGQSIVTETGHDYALSSALPDSVKSVRVRFQKNRELSAMNGSNAPMIDIIGDYSNHSTPYYANLNDISWLGGSNIPNGSRATWHLSHRVNNIQKVLKSTGGDAWTVVSTSGYFYDIGKNNIVFNVPPSSGELIMVMYDGMTKLGFEYQKDDNYSIKQVEPFAWFGNSTIETLGANLLISMIGKSGSVSAPIGASDLSTRFAINGFEVHNFNVDSRIAGYPSDNWLNEGLHDPIGYPIGHAAGIAHPSVKTLITLMEKDGRLFLGLIFEEDVDSTRIRPHHETITDLSTGQLAGIRVIPLPYLAP